MLGQLRTEFPGNLYQIKQRVGLLGLVFNLKWCDLKNKVMLVLKAADFGGKFDVLSDKSSSRILRTIQIMILFPKRILPGVGAIDYRPHCVLTGAQTLLCSTLLQTANAYNFMLVESFA